MAEDLGRSVLHLVTDPTQLKAGLAAARTETLSTLSGTQRSLQSIGSQISATGSKMTVGLTAPVLGLGAAITTVGGDFQHTMSEIVGLVGVGRDQVNAWKPEIEKIAAATGVGPEQLAKALYFVASSGLDASKAMDVLKMSARAAEAGMGDAGTIAAVLTSSLNAYTRQGLQAAEATDILTRGIQVGAAEPIDFANAIGTVAPAAAQLNVSYKDLIGTTAVLSRVNKNVAEDATSLGQIFNTLLKPTNQTNDALQAMGLSAGQLRDVLANQGLMAMLRLLASHIGDDDEAIAKIFPNIRALRGVLNLTGQDAKTVDEAMAKVADSTGALDDAVNAVADDASTKLAQANAKMQDDLVNLGNDVLPTVVSLMDKLAGGVHGAVTWFEQLPPDVKNTAVQGLALLAVLGPILVILGSLVGAVGGLVGAGTGLATFLTATLIPRILAFGTAVLSVGIETLASMIFSTGIPALEALAVSLLGVEAAAVPLLILFGVLAGLVVLANNAHKDLVNELAKSDAPKDQIDRVAHAIGMQADELERAVAAAREKAAADVVGAAAAGAAAGGAAAAAAALADSSDAAALVAGGMAVASAGFKSTGKAATDMESQLHDAMDKAIQDVAKFASDTLSEVQSFRTSLESAFKTTQDTATDAAETQAQIAITIAKLASEEKDYTDHHKGWSDARLAQWQLEHIGTVKELNELKLHAALIGTSMQQEQSIQALLTSRDVKKGLTSKFPEVKAAYENLRDQSLLHLWEIAQGTGPAAAKAASDLALYLNPANPQSPMHNAPSWGGKTAKEWLDALYAKFEKAGPGLDTAMNAVVNRLKALSPPGPLSPLHEIGRWGERTGDEYMTHFAGALGTGSIDTRLGALAARLRSASFGAPGLQIAMDGPAAGSVGLSRLGGTPASRPGLVGPLVGVLNVDASGHRDPAAVGAAVKQAIADGMADVFRDQEARGFMETAI